MRLTTKGRYAVTAMLDLALHKDNGPISLAEISSRQDISLSYLEQLFVRLRRQGLVTSSRGPGGGYTLAVHPASIAIADIILAVDEKLDSTGCGSGSGGKGCHSNDEPCLTHSLWESLNEQVRGYLSGVTLAQTTALSSVLEVAARQDEKRQVRVTVR
ncbi:MAG: Rrf2 family transcriptional regulator [Gammaproteobacteria bacterium]|nr:Rrf2 family transcriptional regulator [Gammaproteobacteria bacterium]